MYTFWQLVAIGAWNPDQLRATLREHPGSADRDAAPQATQEARDPVTESSQTTAHPHRSVSSGH
jgi:hypothetical protein